MACAGSTELSATTTDPGCQVDLLDPSAPYELDPAVALRPEPFGALAYHYGNRRLNFLRSKALVTLVESLGAYDSVDEAMDAAAVAPAARPAFTAALGSLLRSDVIRAR